MNLQRSGRRIAALAAAAAITGLLFLGNVPDGARAGGSGTVWIPGGRAAWNANEFTMPLQALNLTALANCFADPSLAGSGSGSSVTFGASTATDTTKNFAPNALSGKPVYVSGQTIQSGPAPTYTLTTVTDPSASYTANALAGLTVSAANIFGSGATVTYTANSLTDTSKNFTPNALVGRTVNGGAASGTVASNTATTITLTSNWNPGTPPAGAFWVISTATGSGLIVSNTATTLTIAGTWTPTTPTNSVSFTIGVPAGKVTGSGGAVTYTRRVEGGSGSTYTGTTLTDAAQAWTPNEFVGAVVEAGGKTGTVTSNTATSITLSAAWSGGTPANGSSYVVYASVKDTGKNLAANQVAGLSIVAVVPAQSGSGGTVTYSSNQGSGASVTYGASTLTDTSKSYAANSLAGRRVVVGDVSGVIASNTATVITLTAPWSVTPINGAAYVIATLTDTSKSFAVNSLAGRTIVSGNNTAVVYSNTATAITLQTAWAPATPAAGAAYVITPRGESGSIQSNTSNQLSLGSGWSPATPPAGTQYYVSITSLSGTIASNTATVMTLNAPWAPTVPTAGSTYQVVNSQPVSQCGLGSYQTTVTFDNTKLQYVGATNGPFLTSTGRPLFVPCNPVTTATTVSFTCSTTGQIPLGPSGTGNLVNLRFKPLVSGPGGSTTLSHTTTVVDIQGDTIDHVNTNGDVLFSTCADVSGNGVVTISDVLEIVLRVGQTSSSQGWDPKYDLAPPSGAITISDALYALAEVGQFCTYP